MLLQHINYDEDEVAVALELIKEKRLKGIIFLGLNYYHPEGELERSMCLLCLVRSDRFLKMRI